MKFFYILLVLTLCYSSHGFMSGRVFFKKNRNEPTFIATGGSISFSGGYKIHSFYSSGTFSVTKGQNNVTYLIVGGGGRGGAGYRTTKVARGGGGGSGGYVNGSMAVSAASYPIVVGAGDPRLQQYTPSQGGTSSFNSISATGGKSGTDGGSLGGAGGSPNGVAGINGGPGVTEQYTLNGTGYGTGGSGGLGSSTFGSAGSDGVVIIKYIPK